MRMEYRPLGSTGTAVSTLCLGTMTFGKESDEKLSHAQLDRFVERGGNFIDTADVYSQGISEEIIGQVSAIRWCSPPRVGSRWALDPTTTV
jgi:aryl-alcohol dehydrogenase (NADP+)